MGFTTAAASGVLGAIAMLGLIFFLPFLLGGKPLDLPLFLGSMFSLSDRTASLVGAVILVSNGSVIACLGRLILPFGKGAQPLLPGLDFGASLGLVSIGMMKILFAFHPKAAELRSIPEGPVAIFLWLGHLIHGGCVGVILGAS